MDEEVYYVRHVQFLHAAVVRDLNHLIREMTEMIIIDGSPQLQWSPDSIFMNGPIFPSRNGKYEGPSINLYFLVNNWLENRIFVDTVALNWEYYLFVTNMLFRAVFAIVEAKGDHLVDEERIATSKEYYIGGVDDMQKLHMNYVDDI
ncbi:hypothetical protein ACJX0J_012545 [Zea mays]